MKGLSKYILNYPDFPIKGTQFKDILGLLQDPCIFRILIEKMASSERIKNSDAILAIDARGFIFGTAISLFSSKPMIVARKPNKLPGELLQKKYKLEYGRNVLEIQKKSINKFKKFNIVDDILATGGTARCAEELLKQEGKEVLGFSFVAEISKLRGSEKLGSFVESQIKL